MELDKRFKEFVNKLGETGNTMLTRAVSDNDLLSVERLIDYYGADVNVKNKYDVSPLTIAVRNNNFDIVRKLCFSGILDAHSGLCASVYLGHSEISKFLVGISNFDIHNIYGSSALHIAAELGNLDLIKEILEKKININKRQKEGLTPLHCAAQNGQLNAVEYLISMGADPDLVDNNGFTALEAANRFLPQGEGHDKVIKYLKRIKSRKEIQSILDDMISGINKLKDLI